MTDYDQGRDDERKRIREEVEDYLRYVKSCQPYDWTRDEVVNLLDELADIINDD